MRCRRSTAKKFLAAANFFEVLQIFPKTDVSESVGLFPSHHPRPLTALQTESKLKYAKWKAVDIARAFRESRRPTPGPAGSRLDPDLSSDQFASEQHPPTPPKPVPREPSPPSRSPKRHSPPPALPPADIARANYVPILLGHDKHDNEALSPGRWSTTATPGFDVIRTPGLDGVDDAAGSSDSLNNWHEHVVDPLTQATALASGSSPRTAWVSTDDEPVEDTPLGRGRVRFSLDTPGGSSPPKHASPPFPTQEISPSHRLSDLPPGFIPTGALPYSPTAGSATLGSPRAVGPSLVMSPPPPQVSHFAPTFDSMASAQPFVSSIAPPPTTDPIHVPAYPPPRGVELTPKLVAKAQKHCRFAISALDYEDTQHAIRELKAALETLGVSV